MPASSRSVILILAAAGAACGQAPAILAYRQATSQCILPVDQRQVLDRIAFNRVRYRIPPVVADGPNLYPFVPLGGTMYRDITTGNFVDLDPSTSVLNYLCEHYGNDAHQGCDYGSPSWEEMALGIPIFAALDGTVVDAHDGDPDMNTSCASGGNYVILDHGGGRTAWYYHMKRNSVAVSIGQPVKAGRQLGLVGSSGCAFGPHLHFQSMNGSTVYEPYAGACRPGASGWVQQIDPPAAVYIRDAGVTPQDPSTWANFPARPPTSPQIVFADASLNYWFELCNLPANSTWREHYVRPDGSLEYELGPFNFSNPTTLGFSVYYFPRNVGGMHSIAGTWHIRFDVNNVQVIDIPVEVAATATAGFNRPPLPIAAAFDPAIPQASDVVFARITSPAGIRDLDGDLVRYRYVWKVNGAVVRDVTSSGQADAIPRGTAVSGDTIECTITPNDGHVNGTPFIMQLSFGCYANCDGSTVTPRLTANDFQCFLNNYAAGSPAANCDGSTALPVLTANDFQCFLNKYAAGCS